MNDTSVKSLMSSLGMKYLWVTPCWIVEVISCDVIAMKDTSVESLMSSLGLHTREWHLCWIVNVISRDDFPVDYTCVQSLMTSLGITSLWMTPLLNRRYHLSGWHPYGLHLCWIVDVISRDDIPIDDTSVESVMSSLGMTCLWMTPLLMTLLSSYEWRLFCNISRDDPPVEWHPCDDIPPDKHLVEYRVSFFTSLSLILFSFSWALFSSISSLNTEDIRVPLLYI